MPVMLIITIFFHSCQNLIIGYLDLIGLQAHLESYEKKPLEETRREAGELTDDQVLAGMKKYGDYKHYGHYVSDQSEQLISYLAADVEHYYERFWELATPEERNAARKHRLIKLLKIFSLIRDYLKGAARVPDTLGK